MAKVRIDWNIDAFREIRERQEVADLIQSHVTPITQACNESAAGYVGVVEQGKSRARGAVYTEAYAAIRDNAKNNTLLRALGGH